MTQNITPENLANFYGSEQIYSRPMARDWNYTEGIKFLSDNGASWLVDAILSHLKHNRKLFGQDFIVAKLKVKTGGTSAWLTFDDGNDNILASQRIAHTDFPLPEISIYCENNTLMLPSER
jgi:hypothetical protein